MVLALWPTRNGRLLHLNSTVQSTDSVMLHHDVLTTAIDESEESNEPEFALAMEWRSVSMGNTATLKCKRQHALRHHPWSS